MANEKKYITDFSELLAEWDFEKNNALNMFPNTFTTGSHQKVWWICPKGHSYDSQIKNKANGRGCPVCAGKRIVIGYNDLVTWCRNNSMEYLINEYSEENASRMSSHSKGEHTEVEWICPKGHHYLMKISDRTISHFGCPYCSNHRILSGFNDLETWAKNNNPCLITEYSLHNEIAMSALMPNATVKVFWKCQVCGNEYKSSPNSRVNMGSGCPKCSKRMVSSFPEQACFFYISKIFSDAINGYKDTELGITELDIYIPCIRVGIEYDGVHWHSGEKALSKQAAKYKACQEQDIRLIRISEAVNTMATDCDFLIQSQYNKGLTGLNNAIISLLNYLGVRCDVNVSRDELKIKQQYYQMIQSNSLAECFPEIAQEWNERLNRELSPNMVFKSSADRVWWKCPSCGNEYQMRINTRVGLPIGNCNKCRDHHYGEQFKRSVLQYSITGDFIAEYSSVTEASKATGAGSITICCQKRITSSGGFIWKYKDDCTDISDLVKAYQIKHSHKKK